ncbi:MAG: CHRD domain-containing protein [Candidatus Saccharibacteria bacterium]|nr:CHRD domain-containing protein [Rhodoferax sp.]
MNLNQSDPRSTLARWGGISTLAFALIACGGGSNNDSLAPIASTLNATLSGDQEITPTITGALGAGSLTLTSPSRILMGSITINGMSATAAHVHLGDNGSNGAVIVGLTESAPASGTWAVAANTVLTEAQATAFSSGGLYFNVHSTENPSGEIRGQIGREVYAAQLSGSQEVSKNASTAKGVGTVSLDPVTKRAAMRLTLTGLTATMAHIHMGDIGVNGPVTFTLTETAAGSGIWLSAADTVMTDAQIVTLMAGGFYFNAHSAAIPSGEIRGQVARNVGYANLNATQEVPSNSSTATGVGTLVVNPTTRAVSGGITITGMTATVAHIHTGVPGANGPVALGLTNAGNGLWNVPVNTVLTAEQLKSFKQGSLYFNAHSATYPAGEIRGQIGATVPVITTPITTTSVTTVPVSTGSVY